MTDKNILQTDRRLFYHTYNAHHTILCKKNTGWTNQTNDDTL